MKKFFVFIRVEGLNTPPLGAVKRYSTPNTIPFKKQHTPLLAAGLLIIVCCLSALFPVSCSTLEGAAQVETIKHGTGTSLGTVYASAEVSEDKASGELTGDTMKYGFIENLSVSFVTGDEALYKWTRRKYSAPENASEKAFANAVYHIIRQVKEKGGNAVNRVITEHERRYDPAKDAVTVRISVQAEATMLR